MQGFDGIGWLNTYRVFENQPHCFKSISTVVPILQQSVVFDGKQSRIALQKVWTQDGRFMERNVSGITDESVDSTTSVLEAPPCETFAGRFNSGKLSLGVT